MTDSAHRPNNDLTAKIALLVQERGWNQEDFARLSQLNRQTVRDILCEHGDRKLRNATIGACARALGLSVSELREQPLVRLLPRMNPAAAVAAVNEEACKRRLHEHATQPELQAWLERNPERAQRLDESEIDELLSLQGTGGPLTSFGVEHFVDLIERRKKLLEMVQAVAGTEYLELLEQFIGVLYEKVQPYRDRT
jgi:transcriptional regulator with XRE-family HTH domain